MIWDQDYDRMPKMTVKTPTPEVHVVSAAPHVTVEGCEHKHIQPPQPEIVFSGRDHFQMTAPATNVYVEQAEPEIVFVDYQMEAIKAPKPHIVLEEPEPTIRYDKEQIVHLSVPKPKITYEPQEPIHIKAPAPRIQRKVVREEMEDVIVQRPRMVEYEEDLHVVKSSVVGHGHQRVQYVESPRYAHEQVIVKNVGHGHRHVVVRDSSSSSD